MTLEDDPGEGSPLLGDPARSLVQRKEDEEELLDNGGLFSVLVCYFMAIHFLLAFCELILVAPMIQLFENSLCSRYYGFPENGVAKEECMAIPIQASLSTIRGWKSMFDTIPVLLVTIPLGRLSNRFGSRKIMALALFGVIGSLCEVFIVCAFPKLFPLRLVWLSCIILLCGGGLNSASAYMWAMASESIPSSRRSHGFYYIFSAFYVAEMVASFVAAQTTDISPWIPCGLSIGSLVLCLLLLIFMPDIKPIEAHSHSTAPSDTPASGHDFQETPCFSESSAILSAIGALIDLKSNRNIIFLIPVFLVGILRYTTLNILIQYAHVRFKLKISTGAIFYTETAIVNIFLFLFLVPQLTVYLRQTYKIRPNVLDLVLVRTSVCLMCIGALLIGLAPSSKLLPIGVFIFAGGFGSRVSALSLISYWIPEDAKATVYASITVFESFGHAVLDPSMQQIFAASLHLPKFWVGMPFFVAAAFYFMAILSTSGIKIGPREDDEDE